MVGLGVVELAGCSLPWPGGARQWASFEEVLSTVGPVLCPVTSVVVGGCTDSILSYLLVQWCGLVVQQSHCTPPHCKSPLCHTLSVGVTPARCGRHGFCLLRPAGLYLERNEVISLFNFLERLAKAVEIVRTLSLQVCTPLPADVL